MKRFINTDYPKVKDVNKAVSDSVVIFGYLNILMGLSFFLGVSRTAEFYIINDVTTYQFWGSAFLLAGVALLIAHYLNYWRAMRLLLVLGVFIKTVWVSALLQRQFMDDSTNALLLILFIGLGAFQISTYLRFPEVKEWKK